MKNKSTIFYLLFSLLIIAGLASCKKDQDTGAPSIERVRTTSKTDTITNVSHPVTLDSSSIYNDSRVELFDSTVISGQLSHQYAIIGQHFTTTISVSFNGVAVYFNPALITDHSIIITIPANVPFGQGQTDKLIVTTKFGVAEFTFPIQQPPPIITGFSPSVGSTGDIVTITGSIFQGLSGVRFDNTPAEIVSSTSTEIKVKVPAGVVQGYIFVTTFGGTTKSTNSFGFKYIIYLNGLSTAWGGNNGGYSGYSSTLNFANTTNLFAGTKNISVIFGSNYGALQIGYGGSTVSVSTLGLTAIKFSVFGGAGTPTGSMAQAVVNGDYGHAVSFAITAGAYTTYTISLSSLGGPTTITEFVIQGLNVAVPSTIYVDAIGFI
jgi:hypothetical protein